MSDDKPTRQRHSPAERATARLDQATRIADRLVTARDKAKTDYDRLDAEAAAAIVRRDHYATDPDLPPPAATRQPRTPRARRGAPAQVSIPTVPTVITGGQPGAATG